MKYRGEIDGLRAIAVLPVIFFHAGFEIFSGGFVGVDVFFVISGYLITGIIISELAEERFSIATFYERRARRILPALFFVMAACVPFAWLWLPPIELKDFGQSLVAVSTFASNILFWREAGYFDTASELKPLLHTWSLAVEEQYYIIFPILLMMTWKFGRLAAVLILVLVFFVSLSIAEWGVRNYPSGAFFLLPARVWELLAGAFVAFWLRSNSHLKSVYINQVLGCLGLIMISFSILYFDESTPFPGLLALLPTIGTCLIIFCAVPKTVVHWFLSQRLFVSVGLVSYSAYLWHQPLFALARARWTLVLDEHILIGLCGASLLLAYLSWRFVEKPFRNPNVISRSNIFILSLVGILLFSAIGLRFHMSGGELGRFNDSIFSASKIDIVGYHRSKLTADHCHNSGKGKMMPACIIGGDQEPRVALIGDSHAYTLVESLRKELSDKGMTFLQYTKNGCPPSKGFVDSNGNDCRGFMESVQKDLASRPVDFVVLFARWAHYVAPNVHENGLGGRAVNRTIYSVDGVRFDDSEITRRNAILGSYIDFVVGLIAQGKEVIVIGPVPEQGWSVTTELAKNFLISGEVKIKELPKSVHEKRISYVNPFFVFLKSAQIDFVDPTTTFCGEGHTCKALDSNANAFYWDGDHLSETGASLAVRQVLEESSLQY